MGSLILRTAARLLLVLFLQFSVFLLLRGHNEPGGGFVGGLVVSAAFALYALAYDVATARRLLWMDTRLFIWIGLLVAAGSGLGPLLQGRPFMTGQWGHLVLPGIIDLGLGTPLLFDLGAYLVVFGVTLTIIFSLEEE